MAPDDTSDAAARERALDPTRSFIVQAPAGSGKTELLIQRYLALLATVDAPEEIVAITFTRKAAGEMRRRVLDALAAAHLDQRPESPHRARTLALARAVAERDRREDWRVDDNPARLRIQTIDALCAALARQMPVLSGFGGAREMVEDATDLYLEAARTAVALVESGQPVAADVERLLGISTTTSSTWRRCWPGCSAVATTGSGMFSDCVGSTARRSRRRSFTNASGWSSARRRFYPGVRPGGPEAWQALAQSLLTKERHGARSRRRRKRSKRAPMPRLLRAAFVALNELPPASYTDAQWEVLEAIGNLLQHAIAALRVVFAARGKVDFTEVAQAALRALGDDDAPTDLALALDYQVRHILVDEFQDTSISQYELIARLTAGWQPGDGRTLFAVGDPMQSIYRFREAEVGEFLRTWASGRIGAIALEPVRLAANFRSQAGIVDWVNGAFGPMMPAREDAAAGAVPYAPCTAVHPSLAGAAVEVHSFFDGDYEGEAARVVELVAARERPRSGAGPLPCSCAIAATSSASCRGCAPRACASARSRSSSSAGGRWCRTCSRSRARRRIRPIGSPGSRCLRAPWCGLTLADLCALAEGRGGPDGVGAAARRRRASRGSAPTAPGAARQVRAVLAGLVAGALAHGLARRRSRTHGSRSAGRPASDDTALEDAATYLDALEEGEEAGALRDRAQFEARIAALWALPDVHAGANDVQIMTIHKAKGLEFDHVIVPGLGRPPRAEDTQLFLWTEREGGAGRELLVAPIKETGADDEPVYRRMRAIDAERDGARVGAPALCGCDARAPATPPAWRRSARRRNGRSARARGAGRCSRSSGRSSRRVPRWQRRPRRPRARWTLAPAAAAGRRARRRRLPRRRPAARAGVARAARARALARRDPVLVGRRDRTSRGQRRAPVAAARRRRSTRGLGRGRVDACARPSGTSSRSAACARASSTARPGASLAALRAAITDRARRWVLGPHPQAMTEHRLTAIVDGAIERLVIDRLFHDRDRRALDRRLQDERARGRRSPQRSWTRSALATRPSSSATAGRSAVRAVWGSISRCWPAGARFSAPLRHPPLARSARDRASCAVQGLVIGEKRMDIKALQWELAAFVVDRGLDPLHTPRNLSMALAAEAGRVAGPLQVVDRRRPRSQRAAREPGGSRRRASRTPCCMR